MRKKNELSEQERRELIRNVEDVVSDGLYDGEETKVSVYMARPRRKMPDFTILFQATNRMLSKDMSPVECKLLLLLYSDAGYGNYIARSILTLAEDCNLSRQTIATAMKKLMQRHIITRMRTQNDGRHYEYCINPYLSWKGGMPERDKAMKIINKSLKKAFPMQLELFQHEEEKSMNNK